MKLRAGLFCGFLLLSAFAAKPRAQGAPPAGSIEVKVAQAIDSNRDAAGKESLAVVMQKADAGGVTIPQGSIATLKVVKAADGTSTVQVTSIHFGGQPLAAITSSSVTVTGSPSQSAASRFGSALGNRLGGIAQSAAAPVITPSASGARVFLSAGTTLRFQFSMGGAAGSAVTAAGNPPASDPVATAPAAPAAPRPPQHTATTAPPRPNTPAPAAQPAPVNSGSAATTASAPAAGQGKIYFCTNRQILDQPKRKYKEFWSDTFPANAEKGDIDNAWRSYLATTYHLDPNISTQINGGCGDTTVTFTQGWKEAARERYARTTKVEQDRLAAGSPGTVEEHAVIDTGWKYTGGRVEHPASEMTADLRQLIDEDVARGVRFFCQAGALNSVYPGVTNYDCTCFAQKVRDYRMKEYERVGDRMFGLGPGGEKGLGPQLNSLLRSGNPEIDFKSCAAPSPGH